MKINHRVFADAILSGLNQRQAAIRAGYAEKYAAQNGRKLMQNKNVVAYLASHGYERSNYGKATKIVEQAAPIAEPKKKEAAPPSIVPDDLIGQTFDDPKEMILAAMNNPKFSSEQRLRYAVQLLPYYHSKVAVAAAPQPTKTEAVKAKASIAAEDSIFGTADQAGLMQ